MFMKDNIPFSRKYTHICGAETCCMIPNNSNSKKQKIEERLVETGLSLVIV